MKMMAEQQIDDVAKDKRSTTPGSDPQVGTSPNGPRVTSDSATILIACMGLLAILYVARALLFPMALAILLALLFGPVVGFLKRVFVPPAFASAVIVGGLLTLAIGGSSLLLRPAGQWLNRAPASLQVIEAKLGSVRDSMRQIDEATERVNEITEVGREGDDTPIPVEVQQPRLASAVLNTSGSLLAGVLITTVLLYFLLATGDRLLGKLINTIPRWRDKKAVVEMARNVQRGMSVYLLTTTVINLGLGAAIGVAMWLCGLPNPVLWGTMAALLNYVPLLGAGVGITVVALVGLLEFETLGQAAIAPTLYFVINMIEGNFITPALVGRSISLSPAMIVGSLIVWGWMWGIGGAIIAVPLLAVTKIFCDSFEQLRPLGRLLEA